MDRPHRVPSPSSRRNETSPVPRPADSHAGSAARYDPRYHYPHPPPAASERAPRKRRAWPPQPIVEDEAIALRKEAGSQRLLKSVGRDEVPSPGTIDQDPVIMDNPEYINEHEKRFVFKQVPDRGISTLPTPPTSEDERARKARRRPSRLELKKDDERAPELATRTASPYAYTKPTELQRQSSSTNLSTPPSSAASSAARLSGGGPEPLSTRRDSGRISPTTASRRRYDYIASQQNSSEDAIYNSDNDRKPAGSIRLRSNSKYITDLPLSESPRNSSADLSRPVGGNFTGAPSDNGTPIRTMTLDSRRNTDSHDTFPTVNRLNVENSRRPTPLMAATSLSDAQNLPSTLTGRSLDPSSADTYTRSRKSGYGTSRPGSREGSVVNGAPASPSRSGWLSADFTRDECASQEGSVAGSKPPSAAGSRPPSPAARPSGESPRMPRTDMDWSALLAANAARRNKPASRLSSAIPQNAASSSALTSEPPVAADRSRKGTSRETTPAQSTTSLPYPEDSILMGSAMFMPAEQDYAYQPGRQQTLATDYTHVSEKRVLGLPIASPPKTSLPSSSSSAQSPVRTPRPSLNRVSSAAPGMSLKPTDAQAFPSRNRPAAARQHSFAESSQTKKEIAVLAKKGLPACPRPEAVSGKDDWYTIIGHTNIDFCPDCIDTVFERTIFRNFFRRSLPRSYSDKVRCGLASPWIRLAWLLTLQQERTDLTLLQDIADIQETSAVCPGGVKSAQNWYGLRDPDGLFVRDFHLCYGDVRKIECLLPSLAGIFVRLPHRASYTVSTCAIRMDSTRFSIYLDALVSLHEKAVLARKNADPMPLIELVERKTRLRECTKDTLLTGTLWHYIPDLSPVFTVCEDCFEGVVEPEIKKNQAIAKKFNRTVQPAYGEGIGCSCQLYSPHMRKVFARALEDDDMKYLVRKAKERREAEIYLQEKFRGIMSKAQKLSLEGAVTEENERRLNRDLERITKEWKEKWE